MSDPENIDKIKQLTRQLMAEKNEHKLAQGVIESLRLDNESLSAKVLVRDQKLSWRNAEIEANALEMVRLCERIYELEISGAPPPAAGASEREKELQSELNISQRARNELRMEFEAMRDRHEETQNRAFFFQIMFEFDTAETKSLTVEQFDKKIQRFFTRFKGMYPEDKQKSSDEAKRAWKLALTCVHPDKNSNDPFAGEKVKALNKAYEQFKE
jgi:hypothetical protein